MNSNLDKETIKWLRIYGYCLNTENERYAKIRKHLKEFYPFEYYFYVDKTIKEKAEQELMATNIYGVDKPNGYKGWETHFRRIKRNLIKECYGLEKKGIR